MNAYAVQQTSPIHRSTSSGGNHRWWIALSVMALLLMAGLMGCQYESALGQLECDTDEECEDGAYCEGGYCVARPAVAQIRLDTHTRTVTAGQTVSFQAEVYDTNGEILEEEDIHWESSDDTIAQVDQEGTVEALEVGTALITASVGDRSASAAVMVSDVPVDAVVPEVTAIALEEGRHGFVAVDVLDASGESLSGRVVEWNSDDESVAEVSARGDGTAVIYATGVGTATLQVQSEEAQASVAVEVQERAVSAVEIIPGEFTMTEQTSMVLDDGAGVFAQAFDDRGARLERQVQWSSSDESALLIDDEEGQLFLRAQPVEAQTSVTLEAEVEGMVAQAIVNIRPLSVAAVAVSPSGILLEQFQLYHGFSAQVLSEEGEAIDGGDQMVSWESSDENVVAISVENGDVEVEALGLGTAEITAVYDGELMASAFVTVVAESVTDVQVSPLAVTMAEGADQAVEATVIVGSGEDPGDRDVIWSSDDPAVATVNPDGELGAFIFGHSVGTTTVSADVEGQTAPVDVTVEPLALDHVVVTPTDFSLKEGQSFQLSAAVIAGDGRSVPGATVSWEVCDGSALADGDWNGCTSELAQVSADGVVTAQEAGAVSIRAVADADSDVTGEAAMTINAAPVINVALSPAIIELVMGDDTQEAASITAEVFTTNGADGDRTLSFDISPAGVANLTSTGAQSAQVEAQAAGDALVEAAADGAGEEAVGRAFVMVAAEPVDGLVVQPVDDTSWSGEVMVGTEKVFLEALAQMRGGDTETVSAHWWTSEPDKLGVGSNGGLVGLAPASQVEVFAFYEGQVASVLVDVVDYDTADISVTPDEVTLEVGETTMLSADIDSGAGCPVTSWWSSDDSNVAVVDNAGKVAALSAGTAQVSVHCGQASAAATVTVEEPAAEEPYEPDSVEVVWTDGEPTFLAVGETANLEALIDGDPSTECEEPLMWATSDTSRAVVGSDGTLAIVGGDNGDTLGISVSCAGISDSVTVEIAAEPTSVVVSCEEQCTTSGNPNIDFVADPDEGKLQVDVLYGTEPFEACTPLWASSNEDEIAVTQDGSLSGADGGAAAITVYCGGVWSTVNVVLDADWDD